MTTIKSEIIEMYQGNPLDSSGSFNVYIGKNIPQNEEDILLNRVRTIPEDRIETFFRIQNLITGYTRIQAKGKWTSQVESFETVFEDSELIVIFDVSLRIVVEFALEYIDWFGQEAVYIDILQTSQIIVKKESN